MPSSRRTFLKQCSFATAGGSILPAWTSVAEAAAPKVKPLPLSELDQSVLGFVKAYSPGARIAGASVLARRRGKRARVTQVLAPIDSSEDLSGIWSNSGLPAGTIFACGNSLSFTQGDSAYQIDNLLPDAASRRFGQLRTGRGVAFAHDALTCRPDDGAVSDPLGASDTRTLKLHVPGGTLPAALENVLRGWIEAKELDLRPGDAFSRLQGRVLHASAARPSVAQPVVRVLMQWLSDLADNVPVGKVVSLFRSRVISTALATIRGISSEELTASFERLRSSLGEEIPDSAVWLALVFKPELQDGAVQGTNATESPDHFQSVRSRAAFALARQVAANPNFL